MQTRAHARAHHIAWWLTTHSYTHTRARTFFGLVFVVICSCCCPHWLLWCGAQRIKLHRIVSMAAPPDNLSPLRHAPSPLIFKQYKYHCNNKSTFRVCPHIHIHIHVTPRPPPRVPPNNPARLLCLARERMLYGYGGLTPSSPLTTLSHCSKPDPQRHMTYQSLKKWKQHVPGAPKPHSSLAKQHAKKAAEEKARLNQARDIREQRECGVLVQRIKVRQTIWHRTPHTAHRTPHTAHRTPHAAHRTSLHFPERARRCWWRKPSASSQE